MMIIPLDRASETPLYRQIVQHLQGLIESGALAAGTKLPATRELAAILNVNRNTVNTAYEELLARGLIVAHVGQGTFVAPIRQEVQVPAPYQGDQAAIGLDWYSLFSKGTAFAEDPLCPIPRSVMGGQSLISFAAGSLHTELFPVDQLRKSIDRALREFGESLIGYGSVDGFAPLKSYLNGYLLDRGIASRLEELLVTNGSQQGIDLVARAFVDPGDTVVMEAPTYTGAISVFRALRANIITIPPLSTGFEPAYLDMILQRQRPKLIYVVPNFHNPTGLTADLETRKRFLETVSGYSTVVVEDDTHERLRYDGTVVPALRAITRCRQIIYLSTFSSVFPGLRLGWVVADRSVTERLAVIKRITDMHTSDLIQASVYDFCQRRWMERSIERVNAERATRRDALLAALSKHMPDSVRWTRPEGGLFLTLTLPEGIDSQVMLDEAVAAGVLYTPGPYFHANGGGQNELRLIFPRIPLPSIDEGIRRLAGVIVRVLQETDKAPVGQSASIDPMM